MSDLRDLIARAIETWRNQHIDTLEDILYDYLSPSVPSPGECDSYDRERLTADHIASAALDYMLAVKDVLDIDNAHAVALQLKRLHEAGDRLRDAMAGNPDTPECDYCGSLSHNDPDCPEPRPAPDGLG